MQKAPVMTLVTKPVAEPVTLAQLKAHLRVMGSGDDVAISAYGSAAVRVAEGYTGQQLINATWTQKWDGFPLWEIQLGKGPLASVTSFTYIDASGDTQALVEDTDFIVDYDSKIIRITPAYGKTWPECRGQINAVVLTGVFGYGAMSGADSDVLPDLFPSEYITFIKMCTALMYEQREPVSTISGAIPMTVPMTYYQFIRRYKYWET